MTIARSCCLFLLLGTSGAFAQEFVSVVTQKNAIRDSCRFFAPIRATVEYQDQLQVVSRQEDWLIVTFQDQQGCIHATAVQEMTISLTRLAQENIEHREATQDEVSLAGKGFNPQVEKTYRDENPGMDFDAVEKIMAFEATPDTLERFIEEGGLNPIPFI